MSAPHQNFPQGSDIVTGESEEAREEQVANPFNLAEGRKWSITLATAVVTLLVGLNATAIATAAHDIAGGFDVSDGALPNSFWPVTVWNTGAAILPLAGLPLLEKFGNQVGYLVSYATFVLLIIPQAVARNFATLLVVRALAGGLGGLLQNAMNIFVADVWQTEEERDLPVALFIFSLLAGVTLGPVFGSLVSELSWRWIFYIQLIIYCAYFPILLLAIRETRSQVLMKKQAKKGHVLSQAVHQSEEPALTAIVYEAITRPVTLFGTEPVVFFLTLWSSFCFGLVFLSTQSIAQVYSTNYGFSDGESGLIQSALLVGELIGFLACLVQDKYYHRSAARTLLETGSTNPEARLPLSIPASLLGLAGGLFWYGWGSYPHVHWIVPTVGLGFVGVAVMVIITTVDNYLTDSYARNAGSAVAAVAFGENMFAAWLPLAANSMYTSLGFQWASSLLGFAALALTLAPITLLLKGETIRRKSKFIQNSALP